jgi:tetratricopeptide (TPR) repeat protein
MYKGDYRGDPAELEQLLTLARERGDRWSIAYGLATLALAAVSKEQYQQATAYLEESTTLFKQLGSLTTVPLSLNRLGQIAFRRGDLAQAESSFEEAMVVAREVGRLHGVADALAGLASVAAARDQLIRAARLLGAVASLRENQGTVIPAFQRADEEALRDKLRTTLGRIQYELQFSRGQDLTLEAAVADARLSPALDGS